MERTAHRRQSRDPDVFDNFDQVVARIQRGHWGAAHAARPAADGYDTSDSMPVFLTNPDGEPDPMEFGIWPSRRSAARRRLMTAGLVLALLVSFAVAYHWTVGRIPADDAKGAIETAADAAATALAPQDLQAAPAPTAPALSREAITSTYQSALQSPAPTIEVPAAQVPAVLPPPAAFPQPDAMATIHRMAPDEVASRLKRGENLIASGDVAAARLVLRRAAEAGNARAATTLAGTYDPAVLAKLDVHGVVPDMEMARVWYEKAKQFGSPEAFRRLETLASKRQ